MNAVSRLGIALLPVTTAAALAVASPAAAQRLPDGTRVRIVADGLGGKSLDGKVMRSRESGCTMIVLDQVQPGGYTMVALNGVGKLERQQNGRWIDIPVKPLVAGETRDCREAAND